MQDIFLSFYGFPSRDKVYVCKLKKGKVALHLGSLDMLKSDHFHLQYAVGYGKNWPEKSGRISRDSCISWVIYMYLIWGILSVPNLSNITLPRNRQHILKSGKFCSHTKVVIYQMEEKLRAITLLWRSKTHHVTFNQTEYLKAVALCPPLLGQKQSCLEGREVIYMPSQHPCLTDSATLFKAISNIFLCWYKSTFDTSF